MERRITRREFFKEGAKKAAKIAAGLAGAGVLHEIAKETTKNTVENASEGIYYLLTDEKIQLEAITEENYDKIFIKLRKLLSEKLRIKVDFRIFKDLDEGINDLIEQKNKTIIIITWPTKNYPVYEPSLGILLDIKENYIKVWDPNKGEVEYEKTLNVWR
jgi:hypothetical protein